MMKAREGRLGDRHTPGSIYDDYFHSKHYITGMNDLLTEILEPTKNETNHPCASTTDRL
jgi:hypothetical protein